MLNKSQVLVRMLVEVVNTITFLTQFNRSVYDVCRYTQVKNNWHDAVTQRDRARERESFFFRPMILFIQ
jgi:hypothetical protein